MLDNFEPQEKKAIIIFIALLALGLVYVGTHEMQWENPVLTYASGSMNESTLVNKQISSQADSFV